jgi:hypothetical protein
MLAFQFRRLGRVRVAPGGCVVAAVFIVHVVVIVRVMMIVVRMIMMMMVMHMGMIVMHVLLRPQQRDQRAAFHP